jgi:hypothetical protein
MKIEQLKPIQRKVFRKHMQGAVDCGGARTGGACSAAARAKSAAAGKRHDEVSDHVYVIMGFPNVGHRGRESSPRWWVEQFSKNPQYKELLAVVTFRAPDIVFDREATGLWRRHCTADVDGRGPHVGQRTDYSTSRTSVG